MEEQGSLFTSRSHLTSLVSRKGCGNVGGLVSAFESQITASAVTSPI